MIDDAGNVYQVDHKEIRRLILSKFENDVLKRQEVEVWLDELVAPGEQAPCECEELGLCYCDCKTCNKCGKEDHDV